MGALKRRKKKKRKDRPNFTSEILSGALFEAWKVNGLCAGCLRGTVSIGRPLHSEQDQIIKYGATTVAEGRLGGVQECSGL